MKKKILVCLITIALIFQLVPFSVYSAELPCYEIENKTVELNDEFSVDVSIANNPGIVSLRFSIVFDSSFLELLSVSDALILASGTVALEACLYQTPMIIAYRGPQILYWIYLMVRCLKRVSLPNIIADKSIVPELIQYNVSAQNITYEIEELLYNQEKRVENIKQLGLVKEFLSNKNSALEVAKVIDIELFS